MEPSNRRIRLGSARDAEELAALEKTCFPPLEAAGPEQFRERLRVYPDHFWLLEEDGRIIAMVDGMATDREDLTDDLFADAGLHREDGAWQMLFGVCTLPEKRRQGCAALLLRRAIGDAKEQGRRGLVLTAKEALVPYYARFGFISEGRADSVHGGAVWTQMRLTFPEKT